MSQKMELDYDMGMQNLYAVVELKRLQIHRLIILGKCSFVFVINLLTKLKKNVS